MVIAARDWMTYTVWRDAAGNYDIPGFVVLSFL
jgi:hypothetical protein